MASRGCCEAISECVPSDCDDQKYESDSDISTMIFVIVQFLIWLVLVILLMSDMRELYFNDHLFALFLLFSVGRTAWHLKGKVISWIFEGARSILVILLMFFVSVWNAGSQIVQVLALQASFNLIFFYFWGFDRLCTHYAEGQAKYFLNHLEKLWFLRVLRVFP